MTVLPISSTSASEAFLHSKAYPYKPVMGFICGDGRVIPLSHECLPLPSFFESALTILKDVRIIGVYYCNETSTNSSVPIAVETVAKKLSAAIYFLDHTRQGLYSRADGKLVKVVDVDLKQLGSAEGVVDFDAYLDDPSKKWF